ncbi:hypothetical protein HS125_07735 [bacterium]|nr:hypothetical protein [bacterium]
MFQNVEVFYYDGGTDSDGRTAFANGNSTLSTENRLEILSTYVKELQRLYGVDPTRSPISDDEVRQALAGLKPRPLPAVRRELDLTTARAFAAPRGYRRAYACAFEPEGGWGEDWDGARVVETDGAPFGRSAAQLRAGTGETTTMRGRAGRISLRADAFYRVSFDYRVLASPEPAGRLNFSVESRAGQGRRAARVGRRSWREGAGVSGRKEIEFRTGPREDYELVFSAVNGSDWLIDNIEIAEVVAGWSPRGWNQPGYDDTQWSTCPVPQRYLHSQTTLLRIPFTVRDGRRVALFSAGIRGPITVWINGRKALERRNEHPFELEITSYVTLGDNLLAMEVAPEYRGQGPQGRMTMRETSPVFLSDLFISTTTLSEKSARLRWRATVHNPTDRAFEGTVTLSVTPWLPVESTKIAGEGRLSASLPARSTRELEGFLTLPSPQVWTPDSPALYLARAVLSDGKTEIDDVVDTFGVRTIEQRDGTLLLNGRPIVLRGAGDFSVFPPLSLADPTAAVPPRELLLRNVLLLKRMNANLFRWFPGLGMSAIDYESMGHPSNDETLPMLCDQLGMMLQWGAGFWVWQHDHEDDWRAWFSAAIPPAVRLHRNRPSVAIWEAGNENWHGMGRQEGTPVWSAWWDFCYELIKDHDDTRLILPSSYGIANRDIERAVSGKRSPCRSTGERKTSCGTCTLSRLVRELGLPRAQGFERPRGPPLAGRRRRRQPGAPPVLLRRVRRGGDARLGPLHARGLESALAALGQSTHGPIRGQAHRAPLAVLRVGAVAGLPGAGAAVRDHDGTDLQRRRLQRVRAGGYAAHRRYLPQGRVRRVPDSQIRLLQPGDGLPGLVRDGGARRPGAGALGPAVSCDIQLGREDHGQGSNHSRVGRGRAPLGAAVRSRIRAAARLGRGMRSAGNQLPPTGRLRDARGSRAACGGTVRALVLDPLLPVAAPQVAGGKERCEEEIADRHGPEGARRLGEEDGQDFPALGDAMGVNQPDQRSRCGRETPSRGQ